MSLKKEIKKIKKKKEIFHVGQLFVNKTERKRRREEESKKERSLPSKYCLLIRI